MDRTPRSGVRVACDLRKRVALQRPPEPCAQMRGPARDRSGTKPSPAERSGTSARQDPWPDFATAPCPTAHRCLPRPGAVPSRARPIGTPPGPGAVASTPQVRVVSLARTASRLVSRSPLLAHGEELAGEVAALDGQHHLARAALPAHIPPLRPRCVDLEAQYQGSSAPTIAHPAKVSSARLNPPWWHPQ